MTRWFAAILGCSVFAATAVGWTSAQNVSNQPSGSRAFAPHMAADAMGNVHLVWAGGLDPSTNWRVYYQMFNGTSWTVPVSISGPNATRPDIAVDGNGTLHVAYEEAAEDNIWYRSKSAGGSWTSPVNLRTGGRSIAASISVNSAGNRIIVAWHEDNQVGAEWDIFVNIYNGSGWTGTTNISSNSSLSGNPKTCIDAQGNMHVAWSDSNLLHRKRDTNGNWGPIGTLFNITNRAGVGSLATSTDGLVHAGYTVDDGSGAWRVWYKYYNGAWGGGTAVYAHTGTTDDIDPAILTDSLGRLYMVWHNYADVYYSTAATYQSSWSAATAIVSGNYSLGVPRMVIDTSMTARVAWQARPASADGWDIYVSSQSVGTPGPSGTLAGEVRDQFNNLLSGAVVSTGNAAGVTNASGQFSFAVPVGTYTATASRQYFTSQAVLGVVISQNQTTTRNFQIFSIAPDPVSGVTVTAGNRQNVLSWTNPGSGQFAGTRIRVRTDGVDPTGPNDGTQVADVPGSVGAAGNYTHSNLTNGVSYRYALFAYDNYTTRSYAAGQMGTGTPAGPSDLDRDGDVDQVDWGLFQVCLTGEFNPQNDPACARTRFDADDDVDDADVALFIGCISGPNVYANPNCVP